MFMYTKSAFCAGSTADREYEFTLKLRVECPTSLWQAAAKHCANDSAHSPDDIADLIGPMDDPSIEDCLMALALPDQLPGCTMLDVLLAPDAEAPGSAEG
jgi:hypothetical protein